MMEKASITYEDYLDAARDFVKVSETLFDGWFLFENEPGGTFVGKEEFFQYHNHHGSFLLKVEYVIFYNWSYGVPAFSFNLWNSSGSLLTLEDIRKMAFVNIKRKDFYSVITQQEHPILQRPFYIVHPCHTESSLAAFKHRTRNIIVTFLGLVTPIVRLKLPLEYGLWYDDDTCNPDGIPLGPCRHPERCRHHQ